MNHSELVVLENLLTFLYAGVCCLGTGLFNSLSFYVKLSDVKVNEGGLEVKFTPLPDMFCGGYYLENLPTETANHLGKIHQKLYQSFQPNWPEDRKYIFKNDSKSIVFQERQVSDAVGKAWGPDGWAFHRLRGHLLTKKEGSWWPQIWGAIFWDSWYIWSPVVYFGGFNPIWDHGQRSRMDDYCRNVCFGRCIVFCLAPGPFVDIPCWRECEIIIQILIYGWGIWGNLSPYNKMAKYLESRAQSNCKPISHEGNSAKGNRNVS